MPEEEKMTFGYVESFWGTPPGPHALEANLGGPRELLFAELERAWGRVDHVPTTRSTYDQTAHAHTGGVHRHPSHPDRPQTQPTRGEPNRWDETRRLARRLRTARSLEEACLTQFFAIRASLIAVESGRTLYALPQKIGEPPATQAPRERAVALLLVNAD